MSLEEELALERRRRGIAEAEVLRLQAQLESKVVAHALVPTSLPFETVEQDIPYEEELVRQIIDSSPYIIYVEDERGQCLLANQRYKQFLSLGPSSADAQQVPFASIVNFSANWPVSGSVLTSEENYLLQNGTTIWHHTTKSLLVRNNGARCLLTCSADITELKRAQQAIEALVQTKQEFIAKLSHEIRTPLHGVMGLVELLNKSSLSAEQADYVELIEFSTKNLLVVIDDVLDFARMELGKVHLETISFDVLKTVQNTARSFAANIAEKGLQLRVDEPISLLPPLQGDPHRLHQVLVNLINNAIKFTHQGTITITLEAGEQIGEVLPVTFSVTDTGIGIKSSSLDYIFDSFQQADSSIPRLYGGAGLGLSICRNLIELQGGKIGVRSELGQGSCFYFTIPYVVGEKLKASEPVAAQSIDMLQGLTILLVEDNPINQLIAVSMLGEWQVQVDMAQNGEEAVAKAQLREYDIILMDIQMPQQDGLAATALLRANSNPNQHTLIIALTADVLQINANSYQAQGFNDYLLKPFSEAALYELLVRVNQRGPLMVAEVAPTDLHTMTSRRHYNLNMLGKLAIDPVFVRKLLELFISKVPGQVYALQEAVEQNNRPMIGHEAHMLKTIFGNLQIEPETEYLRKLETLADKETSKAELMPLVKAVAETTELLSVLFQEELGRLS
ncbi:MULTISPECIES: ATP-binding protein [Hymenobacter]|uniref:histidine kinase n=1 Tax=Hymenobacter profundi TaxID=1982110 RepID=A0ABS6WVN6_9BACT|nr:MULTISPECIES: ATP-binding protein [Hymenobacter]MBW3127677.1 response regulator [Hymenobacter profundi]QNE38260.1 response regulator [Hymenobacter sp. NBH84]